MTSRSRRSVEKEKVSYVFMSLRRRALQAHVCTATWSWTCCSAALIIVSPLTDRNRSEAWLLPECKQSSSQKSFLFFISLLADPPPPLSPPLLPHIQLFCHTLQQRQPPCCLNCSHRLQPQRQDAKTQSWPILTIWWGFQWENPIKTINHPKARLRLGDCSDTGRIYSHLLSIQLTFKYDRGSPAGAGVNTKMYSRCGGAQALHVSYCSESCLRPVDSSYILLAPVAAGLRCSAWALNWNNRLLSPRPC